MDPHREARGHLLDPLSPVPPSRHPFQFWVLAACLFAGVVNLVTRPDTAFAESVPYIVTVIWGLLLSCSSLLGLVSAWWSDRITGLLMERAALTALGIGAVSYGLFLILVVGSIATFPGSLTFGVGVASLWRVRHINREISVLTRLIAARQRLQRQIEEQ